MSNYETAKKQAAKILSEAILKNEVELTERIANFDSVVQGMLREVGCDVMSQVATDVAGQAETEQRGAGFTVEERSDTLFLHSSDRSE
jgi:hypothetical protein